MIPAPHVASNRFGATKTYRERLYNWTRCPELRLGTASIDGLLALRLKKFKGGEEFDLYACLYEGEDPFLGHVWLLYNVFDRKQKEPYKVCVGRVLVTCTCQGKECGKNRGTSCKHSDSFADFVARPIGRPEG